MELVNRGDIPVPVGGRGDRFREQGRIMKSVKSWRDEALAKGWLVAFEEGAGKVAIFISHTYARTL